MYKLMVSHNCGITYVEEAQSEDPEDFRERCKELDEIGLRYGVDDENGEPLLDFVCARHLGIMGFMVALNAANQCSSD